MTGHDDDFEELRPPGEASPTPEYRFDERGRNVPSRQHIETNVTEYPANPTKSVAECRYCGTSIPAAQTECRFCPTSYLDARAPDKKNSTPNRTFVGIIHMLVESASVYGAIAKGSVAANLLSAGETESTVDECTLIDDLDREPARQLAEPWPALPEAANVASDTGEQLLAAARHRMGSDGDQAARTVHSLETHLYDESGSPIRRKSRLESILEMLSDEVWLVPAIALTEGAKGSGQTLQEMTNPNTEWLDCQRCKSVTEHQFHMRESHPDETWSGQPIWECQECGFRSGARYDWWRQ